MSPTGHQAPDVTSQRYKLTIAYDGHRFHGWQKQEPPGQAPLRTVAGVVESTLVKVLRQPIRLVGASRTDAGVHALGQVAHFDAVGVTIPTERLAPAINSRLPEDVEVRAAEPVPNQFDAIRGARSKRYRYTLHHSPQRPLTMRHTVFHCWVELDIGKMNDAAGRLVGTHDFEGFANAGHGRESTVRTVHACRVEREGDGPRVHIVIEGDGFLYNMVRIIAGTLVEVGRGRLPPQAVDRLLETRNRREAGPTLPPEGLCLEWIRY